MNVRLLVDFAIATLLLIITERVAAKAAVDNEYTLLLLVACFLTPSFAAVIAGGSSALRALCFCFVAAVIGMYVGYLSASHDSINVVALPFLTFYSLISAAIGVIVAVIAQSVWRRR